MHNILLSVNERNWEYSERFCWDKRLELIQELTQVFPILCCDDTFAEVDTLVKKEVISLLEKRTQLFYTSVLKDDFSLFNNPLVFEMREGELQHG